MTLLTDERLAEIQRRSEQDTMPDGYGAGGSSIRSSDVADPTASTVMELIADRRHPSDPQMVAFLIIERNLRVMARAARRTSPAWHRVERVSASARGRDMTRLGFCQACHRSDVANTVNDRIVNGYCPACRVAWDRAGHPDRLLFEIARRKEIVEILDD